MWSPRRVQGSSSLAEDAAAHISRRLREHSIWHPEVPPVCCSLSLLSPIHNIESRSGGQEAPAQAPYLSREGSDSSHVDGWPQVYETMLYGGEDAGQLVRVTGMTVSVKGGAVVELGFHVAEDFDGRSKDREAVSDDGADCGNMAGARLRDRGKESYPTSVKSTTAGETRTISVLTASSPSARDVPHGSLGYGPSNALLISSQTASANDTKTTLEFTIDGRAGERVVKIDVINVSYDKEDAGSGSDQTDGGIEPAIEALRVKCFSSPRFDYQ